jgi:hypothetical protein
MRARQLQPIAMIVALVVALLTAPQAGATSSGGVLVVGDSLEVLTSPYLKKYLPGVPLTVNAQGGYNSYQIFDLFKQSYNPSQSVIVFDAGTNDNPAYPQILAGNLSAVANQIGPATCMVVPTIHGLTVNGINSDGKNRVVEQFAASRPGTQVPNWAGFVAAHPELMQSDNLHPTPAGADSRARLIAQGVMRCLNPTPTPGPTRPQAPILKSAPTFSAVHELAKRAAGESIRNAATLVARLL